MCLCNVCAIDICVDTCVYVCRSVFPRVGRVFSSAVLCCVYWTESLIQPRAHSTLVRLSSYCLSPKSRIYRGSTTPSWCFMRVLVVQIQHLISGPHACSTSNLSAEPPPQPLLSALCVTIRKSQLLGCVYESVRVLGNSLRWAAGVIPEKNGTPEDDAHRQRALLSSSQLPILLQNILWHCQFPIISLSSLMLAFYRTNGHLFGTGTSSSSHDLMMDTVTDYG